MPDFGQNLPYVMETDPQTLTAGSGYVNSLNTNTTNPTNNNISNNNENNNDTNNNKNGTTTTATKKNNNNNNNNDLNVMSTSKLIYSNVTSHKKQLKQNILRAQSATQQQPLPQSEFDECTEYKSNWEKKCSAAGVFLSNLFGKIQFSHRILKIAFAIPSNWLTVAYLIGITTLIPIILVIIFYGLVPLGSSDNDGSFSKNAAWIFVTSPFTWTFWAILNVVVFAGCFPSLSPTSSSKKHYSNIRLYISLAVISYIIQTGILGGVVAAFGFFPFIGLLPIAISVLSIYVGKCLFVSVRFIYILTFSLFLCIARYIFLYVFSWLKYILDSL